MAQIPLGAKTHSQKVCSLYKQALRALRDWYFDPVDFRYHAVLLRDRFDKNAKIKDLRKAKDLLIEGEEELFRSRYPIEFKFPESPGGTAYERSPVIPDGILDYWHPMEKAMYPKYFALREKRKKEYEEWYYKEFPEKKNKESH